jgi:Ca2+-transporting ATPase
LEEKKKKSTVVKFLEQFKDLVVIILIVASIVSGLLGEWLDSGAIIAIVILNALIGYIQESRAERALQALKKLTAPTAKVIRDGERKVIAAREVVPGDVLDLEMGDQIPADARIIEAHSFKVEEAALTGESVPVEKDGGVITSADAPLGDRCNMAYMSTVAVYGKARAVAVATGMRTELGKIAHLIQTAEEDETPLQKRLERVGRWLVYASLGIVAVVFALNIWRGENILGMFIIAVSLAVAAVPEGLPAVVTIALALGVQRMVKRKALIRRLPSVETLGSATAICSDKTGTLTQNEMTVSAVYTGGRLLEVSGSGYSPKGEFSLGGAPISPDGEENLALLLRAVVLCNDASLKKDGDGWSIVGDPTEGALLTLGAKGGLWQSELSKEYKLLSELPFDSTRKRMTAVYRNSGGASEVYTKGAPDVMLDLCSHIYEEGRLRPITAEDRKRVLQVNEEMASRALRVLAVAAKEVGGEIKQDALEKDLAFIGLAGMIDPPRPEAREAIEVCKSAGIKTFMITGDHKATALAIAKELNAYGPDDMALSGAEIDKIDDGRLAEIVERVRVFARVSAEHKLKIVRALKKRGHVVAMTGDGVNDAPAVKEADIGIAMGITGTDVTKEASDMVLADDNFATIVAAVEEGRGIYKNIQKFIYYLLSCNAGEIIVMFLSSLFGFPLPLYPIQILWTNLATDALPALALGVDPKEPGIMAEPPRHKNEAIINREIGLSILWQGALIGLITLAAYIIQLRWLGRDLEEARTFAFLILVFSQGFQALNCRSRIHSIFKLGFISNVSMVWALVFMVLTQVAIIYVPFLQVVFKTAPLSLGDWIMGIALASATFWAVEMVKLIRRSK